LIDRPESGASGLLLFQEIIVSISAKVQILAIAGRLASEERKDQQVSRYFLPPALAAAFVAV